MKHGGFLTWPGSKWRLAQEISKVIMRIPHRTYVEVFGGSAAVLLTKPPSQVEVYNDIDDDLFALFRTLTDEKLFSEFKRFLDLAPYSRHFFEYCLETYKTEQNIAIRAAKFFLLVRQSLGAFAKRFGYSKERNEVSGWLSSVEFLPEIHRRLRLVIIEHKDWSEIIDAYDSEHTLFYFDPPYHPETRRDKRKRYYENDMSSEDHECFIERLLSIKGKSIVSGYPHPLYDRLVENGWNAFEAELVCNAVGRVRGSNLKGRALTEFRTREMLWVKGDLQGHLF